MRKIDGYKTFIGIVILFLGAIGYGDIIAEEEAARMINMISEIVGLGIAIYGRVKAKKIYSK